MPRKDRLARLNETEKKKAAVGNSPKTKGKEFLVHKQRLKSI